jgi:hypothetical protein
VKLSELFPSRFISAETLGDKRPAVTIKRVTLEQVDDDGPQRPVIYFENKDSGLVLNKTNGAVLGDLFGQDTNAWLGQRVQLYVETVQFKGAPTKGVRLRAVPVQAVAPPPPPPPASLGDLLDDDIPF